MSGYNNYNRGGYRSNNNYGNGNRNSYQQREQKKHSGCKSGTDRNGKPYVQGWKFDKRNGLRSFYATPYKGTQEVKSKTGKVWQNWFVRIKNADGSEIKTSGMYDVSTGKVIIDSVGFVMNPRGGRGGYLGPYYYRKN